MDPMLDYYITSLISFTTMEAVHTLADEGVISEELWERIATKASEIAKSRAAELAVIPVK